MSGPFREMPDVRGPAQTARLAALYQIRDVELARIVAMAQL